MRLTSTRGKRPKTGSSRSHSRRNHSRRRIRRSGTLGNRNRDTRQLDNRRSP